MSFTRRGRSLFRWLLAMMPLAVPGLLAPLLLRESPLGPANAGAVAANAALCVIFGVLFIVIHELAHVAVGRLVGLRVRRVQLGLGPPLWRRRIGGAVVMICTLPVNGMTMLVPREGRASRWRYLAAIAAGPLVHVAVIAALWPTVGAPDGPLASFHQNVDPLTALLAVNVLLAFTNLNPFSRGAQKTDGRKLLAMPFAPARVFDETAAMACGMDAYDAYEAGDFEGALATIERGLEEYPGSKVLSADRAMYMLELGKLREALPILRSLVDDEHVEAGMRPILRSNLAWALLLLGDDDDLPEADRLSKAALRAMPGYPPLVGTRGAVLAAMGDDDALKPLELAFARNTATSARAHNSAWMALVHAREGDLEDAEEALEQARELDPRCRSLPVVEARLAKLTDSGSDTVEES